MRNERKIIQDSTLGVEALLFNGIQQGFLTIGTNIM
ncbi:hypothetical protein IGJ74_000549 [Enterococcus sp. AZ009]